MPGTTLETQLERVIGGQSAKALEKAFDMHTVGDLLWHLPRRYSKRGELTPLTGLPLGEQVSVVAQVLDVRSRTMQRRRGQILEVRITDGVGTLTLTFFNQSWRANEIRAGRQGIFAGKVSEYRGAFQLQHPDYKLFDEDDEVPERSALEDAALKAWAESPMPLYPATARIPSWNIGKSIIMVLDALRDVEDPIPLSILDSEGLLPLGAAFEAAHRPRVDKDWKEAWASLKFREAFELQLALLHRRQQHTGMRSTPREAGKLLKQFDAALPFELTGDQRRVGGVIAGELETPHPMHRLLQGEVGSGKTLVALRAVLQVAESGGQSALLAPTEVLASQHFRSIVESLGPDLAAELNPVLVTGRMATSERRRALLSLASGASRIAVGTHALMSDWVSFFDLGLTVIDEQHRFGVEQREALRQKGAQPHVLAMTATPIPRTVALTAFGDLETLTIRELPPGRQGIETFVVPEIEMPNRAARVWQRAAEDISAGRQVYVVCPAISGGGSPSLEEGDAGQVEVPSEDEASKRPLRNVIDTVEELRGMPQFAGMRIEALSGDMTGPDKDRVMGEFAAGNIHMLVATTVIEVGVNVPNASIMIVRDADRFGVSQLHQLRGRVGRGEHAGLCLLMSEAEAGTNARERIEAVAATSDGFVLAEIDLELRREGDILGTAQSGGRSTLKLLRVTHDGDLIAHARELAALLLLEDPELTQYPKLARAIEQEDEHLENLAKS
ncbi:MAG: ATP-dependent DNA helicase RecG [Leucobacter sp.]